MYISKSEERSSKDHVKKFTKIWICRNIGVKKHVMCFNICKKKQKSKKLPEVTFSHAHFPEPIFISKQSW